MESLIHQFERVAAHIRWSANKKYFRLLDCLRRKGSLEYAWIVNINCDYKDQKGQLKQRFGRKEVPIIARSQLPFTKQLKNENVEDFAQRVHFLAVESYEKFEGNMIEDISIETFLRGCRDKEASIIAMGREQTTLRKAVKYVKKKPVIANHHALYGTRGTSGTTAYFQQVSILSMKGSLTCDSFPCRTESKFSNEKAKNNCSLE